MFNLVIAFFYVPDVLLACGSIHQGLNPERFTDESRSRRELNVFSCFLFADSRTNVGVSCEQVLPGALAAGRERKENFQLRLWNLNSISNSPVARRRLSCQISANQPEAETSANVNKH